MSALPRNALRCLGLGVVFVACAQPGRIEFVLCPSEVRQQVEEARDLGARREVLFRLDYEVVVVERRGAAIVPAATLRAQHSTGSPRPTGTTLEDPTHVSDYFILDPAPSDAGIAIRHPGETAYRVQWLSDADLSAARRTSVIHLQPLESLPVLTAR